MCDFIDWVADYTLNPPGAILAMALRSRGAFEPEALRIAYVQRRRGHPPGCRRRARACWTWRKTAWRAALPAWRKTPMSPPAVVRGLIQAGALVADRVAGIRALPRSRTPDFAAPELNHDQARAARMLARGGGGKEFSAHLLDGVTGSGKTEVYFEAVAEALRAGKQVLILLPEIALTVQFLERFAARFGVRPAEWHSDLSQKERRRTYRAVMKRRGAGGGGRALGAVSAFQPSWA